MNRRSLFISLVIVLVSMVMPTSISRAEPSFKVIGKVISGRDLAIPVGSLILFGDTTSEQVISGGPKSQDRNNTGGIRFGLSVTPINGDQQLWPVGVPTGGIKVGKTLIAFYEQGQTIGHAFNIFSSGVVLSNNGGKTWMQHPLRNGNSNFSQCSSYPTLIGGSIYLYCTVGGRQGPARLARVAPGSVTNLSAYRYWTGGGWSADENAAVPVIGGTVGELSIGKNPAGGFIALYMSPGASGLAFSTAPSLTGPWSPPVTFYFWDPSGGFSYGTYAPQIIATRGRTITVFFSHFSDYSVYAGELTL